jgi:hypothetical protein
MNWKLLQLLITRQIRKEVYHHRDSYGKHLQIHSITLIHQMRTTSNNNNKLFNKRNKSFIIKKKLRIIFLPQVIIILHRQRLLLVITINKPLNSIPVIHNQLLMLLITNNQFLRITLPDPVQIIIRLHNNNTTGRSSNSHNTLSHHVILHRLHLLAQLFPLIHTNLNNNINNNHHHLTALKLLLENMEYWIQMNKQYIVLLHKHLNNNNTTQNPVHLAVGNKMKVEIHRERILGGVVVV